MGQTNFLNELSNFIFTSKYARFDESKKRRETWDEAVDRVMQMHLTKYSWLDQAKISRIKWAFQMVKDKRVVPSMRSMQFGGNAVFAHHPRIYNCSVRHVDSLRAFAEIFYLLLCGSGVGIGLSKKYLNRLPNLVKSDDKTGTIIAYVVEDNIEGWADSIEALLMCYFKNTPYTGRKIEFDYSKIRKKGAPLKTGGGKAPGPKGLQNCHKKIKQLLDYIIEEEGESKLQPINAYDILMNAADAVLSGGVRRSATSVVFDMEDVRMAKAKTLFTISKMYGFEYNEKTNKWTGYVELEKTEDNKRIVSIFQDNYKVELKAKSNYDDFNEYEFVTSSKTISWYHIEPQRGRSNNSVLLLRDRITEDTFKEFIENTKMWGEPGFVFSNHEDVLLNPCFEISFIPVTPDGRCGVQFCNLTSQNGAKIKSVDDFLDCTEAATIIGTLQAGYTDFPYLSSAARELTEQEALLGVSITGIMDNPEILLNPRNQYISAEYAKKINKEWAEALGINQAARITCVKPEGTASLVLESASGIHPHHARKYIRRVQMNKQDSAYKFFKKHNPHMVEESVWSENKTDDVISFPLEVSGTAMIKDDLTAINHLNMIKDTQQNWVAPGTTEANRIPATHNVSCTVEVGNEEWDEVIDYIYRNREFFAAVSLLSKSSDKKYPQAPLERIISEEDKVYFEKLVSQYKPVDYTALKEEEDKTELMSVASCAGNQCEVTF